MITFTENIPVTIDGEQHAAVVTGTYRMKKAPYTDERFGCLTVNNEGHLYNPETKQFDKPFTLDRIAHIDAYNRMEEQVDDEDEFV